jgi:hypothetical protein
MVYLNLIHYCIAIVVIIQVQACYCCNTSTSTSKLRVLKKRCLVQVLSNNMSYYRKT